MLLLLYNNYYMLLLLYNNYYMLLLLYKLNNINQIAG